MIRGVVTALLLSACSQGAPQPTPQGPPDLETAAIARGLVIDPATVGPVGLYARGGDRLCVIQAGSRTRIGAFVDYGPAQRCTATGSAERQGDTLRIDLGRDCRFEASYDGLRIGFPGRLPAACAQACRGRASFEGLIVDRLSDSPSEAAALRDPSGRMLCASTT